MRQLGKDLPILALGGRVLVIGSRGTVEIDPRYAVLQRSILFCFRIDKSFFNPPSLP
jgi:hypothetical protein